VRDQVSHPYKTTDKIMLLCILIFMFLERRWEDKFNFFMNSILICYCCSQVLEIFHYVNYLFFKNVMPYKLLFPTSVALLLLSYQNTKVRWPPVVRICTGFHEHQPVICVCTLPNWSLTLLMTFGLKMKLILCNNMSHSCKTGFQKEWEILGELKSSWYLLFFRGFSLFGETNKKYKVINYVI
jgi:hypothetical protein